MVDFIVLGIGNPTVEFVGTRYNVGYIFGEYFANCIKMQTALLNEAAANGQAPTEQTIPRDFQKPVFVRMKELAADLHESDFLLSEADMHDGPKSTIRPNADAIIKKSVRLLIVKPLVDAFDSGKVVLAALSKTGINISDASKKLLVVYPDPTILEGSMQIGYGSDVRGVDKFPAVKSITDAIGSNFIRVRIGVASDKLDQVIKPSKEMDTMGYSLDLVGQALQNYFAFEDIKFTKKKFATSKKIPSKLRNLPGLVFPIEVVEPVDNGNKK